MPPRKRAGASARAATRRKRAPLRAKTPRTKRRVPHYQACTPEMEANIRQRYEETDEPIDTIAADRGVAPGSLRRIAATKGWVRRKHKGPTDVTAAMRILAETERLETSLASPPPERAERGRACPGLDPGSDCEAGRVGGIDNDSTPTPTLPLSGGGSPTERGEREHIEPDATAPRASADLHLATIERLEAAVRKELSVVEAMRAAFGSEPYKPYHAQLTTRTLSNLTDTLGKLARLRAALAPQPAAPASTGFTHDDLSDSLPADIDKFRHALARRIEAFLESREADEDAGRDAGPALVHDARS